MIITIIPIYLVEARVEELALRLVAEEAQVLGAVLAAHEQAQPPEVRLHLLEAHALLPVGPAHLVRHFEAPRRLAASGVSAATGAGILLLLRVVHVLPELLRARAAVDEAELEALAAVLAGHARAVRAAFAHARVAAGEVVALLVAGDVRERARVVLLQHRGLGADGRAAERAAPVHVPRGARGAPEGAVRG